MNAADPSEAVCSADIVKLLPDYFDVFEINGYGGSLLHLLLEGITGNFVEDNPRSMSYFQSFFDSRTSSREGRSMPSNLFRERTVVLQASRSSHQFHE